MRKLHDVLRQQEVQGPVHSHPQLLFESRQLAQVNRPPNPPGEKAGELNTQNIRNAGSHPNRCELADCRKHKTLLGLSSDFGGYIVSEHFSLAERMLSGWRVRFAGGTVWDRSAIAQRPHPWPPEDLHELVDDNSAALFRAR